MVGSPGKCPRCGGIFGFDGEMREYRCRMCARPAPGLGFGQLDEFADADIRLVVGSMPDPRPAPVQLSFFRSK